MKIDASVDRYCEVRRFVERTLLGVRRWIRRAVRLRVQGEIIFVFGDDEMREERPEPL